MWWKLTLVILVLTGVCFVLGLYAGGGLFLLLTRDAGSVVSWHTLLDASKLVLPDRRLVFLPWAWCATVAITCLPIGITLLAYFLRLKPVTSLHGNARFANNAELRAFEYKGEYQ